MIKLKIYKNWGEICKDMGWKNIGGKYKQLKMKELSEICKWHKEGHKIFIDEIYSNEKTEEIKIQKEIEKNKNKKKTIVDNLEFAILLTLTNDIVDGKSFNVTNNNPLIFDENTDSGYIIYNKAYFQAKLGLVNFNYHTIDRNRQKYSTLREIQLEHVNDMMTANNNRIKENLERALKKLESRKLIRKNECHMISWLTEDEEYNSVLIKNEDGTYSEEKLYQTLKPVKATIEQNAIILRVERENMRKYNCENESQLIRKNVWFTWRSECDEKIRTIKGFEKFGYCFKSYEIIFNYKNIEDYLLDNGFKLEEIKNSLIEYTNNVNISSINKSIKNAKNRINSKSTEEHCIKYSYRKNDTFVEDIEKITKDSIGKNAEDIIDKIKQINIYKKD